MFCNQFHPLVGGAERQAEKLSRALLDRGCEVAVLTPRIDRDWPTSESLDGLRVIRYPLPDLARRFPTARGLGIPNLVVHRRATERAIAEHLPDYDLLHAHLASSLVAFATDASHRLGRPVICKVAGGGPGFDFIPLRRTSIVASWIARRLVEHVDHWIAISREIRGLLIAEGVPEERIESIPNGVDARLGDCPALPPRIRRFFFIGRAIKCDYATLFKAFDLLLESVPDCELRFVVGREAPLEVFEYLEALPRARERTELLEHTDAREAFAWTDALVQPTPGEGMSNVVLEGMASGIPLIASDIPSNREVLDSGRCGMLVRLGDVPALAEAMQRMALDPRSAVPRVHAARDRARQEYDIKRIADRYVELYSRVAR
jgi:glycosyltransferase involved in cell wall biosynthesis